MKGIDVTAEIAKQTRRAIASLFVVFIFLFSFFHKAGWCFLKIRSKPARYYSKSVLFNKYLLNIV